VTNVTEDNILSGLKVVDLSSFIAGPGAATILSDFGADVVKVEPPEGEFWRNGQKIPPQPTAWRCRRRRMLALSLHFSVLDPFPFALTDTEESKDQNLSPSHAAEG
jgi:crotonobetainyl-CoA:carnitine CoA-transferase CaiB-like acyl-CoA transferase